MYGHVYIYIYIYISYMYVLMCIYICMSTCNIMHACLMFDLPNFDGCFQNKRASGPPAKRLRIEELKRGDSWRTGTSEESQVGQVLFYLLAVQLENIKKKRHPRPLLGLYIEGNEVHTLFCSI